MKKIDGYHAEYGIQIKYVSDDGVAADDWYAVKGAPFTFSQASYEDCLNAVAEHVHWGGRLDTIRIVIRWVSDWEEYSGS